MSSIRRIVVSLFVFFFISTFASFSFSMEHPPAPAKLSKEFLKLKSLEGSWEGIDPEKPNEKVKVKYHATSNGTVLVERLFPGTPNEMISVYYDRGGKPAMTHYCAIGNQPELDLTKSKGKNYEFSFSPRNSIDPEKEVHMHALTITLNDTNHMTQKWVSFENGKEKETHIFNYTRVNQ